MAKAKVKKENAIIRYLRETRSELKKVNWPTREETWRLTQIVIVITVTMAIFLWLMDVLLDWWLRGILASDPWRIGLALAVLAASIVLAIVFGRRKE
ncbi:MAG: preprotein translocase subunit SecE [Anaerolineae bacterium]|nr:preprotein translocase subunit SecE [Anaerolineae bacterium]